MPDRAIVIERFLDSAGWSPAGRRPLPGDASFRRYVRLVDGDRSAMLMDAPPPKEDVRPFARLARHLKGLGLSAPAVLAADDAAGLLLLEDLGDDTYTRLLTAGADEAALYALAVDVLKVLHARPDAVPDGLAPYDDERLLTEATLLTDWYLPAVRGEATPAAVRAAYVAAWRAVFPRVHARPRTLVLRDYHVDNLMRLPGRAGVAACGLLDFQDAVAGAPEYDLMSLLEDARRDVGDDLAAAMLDRYGPIDRDAYAILAAQRHAKVIGIFTRLCVRDGKPGYRVHMPRLWRLLERALRAPALAGIAAWFETHLPAADRRIPPCP